MLTSDHFDKLEIVLFFINHLKNSILIILYYLSDIIVIPHFAMFPVLSRKGNKKECGCYDLAWLFFYYFELYFLLHQQVLSKKVSDAHAGSARKDCIYPGTVFSWIHERSIQHGSYFFLSYLCKYQGTIKSSLDGTLHIQRGITYLCYDTQFRRTVISFYLRLNIHRPFSSMVAAPHSK